MKTDYDEETSLYMMCQAVLSQAAAKSMAYADAARRLRSSIKTTRKTISVQQIETLARELDTLAEMHQRTPSKKSKRGGSDEA